MPILTFAGIIVLIFSFGVGISLLLKIRSIWEIWGVSWLLGMGWGTWLWFLVYFYGKQDFSLQSLFFTLFISNAASWIMASLWRRNEILMLCKEFSQPIKAIQKMFSKLNRKPLVGLAIIVLIGLNLFVAFQDIFWPVTDWDSLALYDFRAKVMVITGSLNQGVQLGYFFQYPLFTSALHATAYLSGLGIAKIWYAVLYQASLITFFALLRKRTTLTMSAMGTLFLAIIPLMFSHGFTAYTNLAYTVYAGLGFIYLWQWWQDDRMDSLILGGMFVGLGTWVRISEPFYFIAVPLVLLGLGKQFFYKKGSKAQVACGIFVLLCVWFTRLPWDQLISSLFGTNVNTPINSLRLVSTWEPMAFIRRSGEVITYLTKYSLSVYQWYFLLATGLLVVDLKHKRWSVLVPWLTICSFLAIIFIGTMLLSFSLESWNRIGDSVTRMSMFLLPMWVYVIFASPSWIKGDEK